MKTALLSGFFALFISVGFAFLFREIQILKNKTANQTSVYNPPQDNIQVVEPETQNCDADCQRLIKEEVSKAVATISAKPSATAKPVVPIAAITTKQTSYIPLSGPISTTSTDWVDAAGTESYIDLVNDYSKDAYITWEATLKVANANGNAFARLFDATHGIAVIGSEVSVSTAGYSTVPSGKLNLWSGNNLYKVQIKSLTGQEATFGSGRIKVVY